METMLKLTFAPRARGRYRCNQTGEITRKPKRYVTAFYNRLRGEEKVKNRMLKNKNVQI